MLKMRIAHGSSELAPSVLVNSSNELLEKGYTGKIHYLSWLDFYAECSNALCASATAKAIPLSCFFEVGFEINLSGV